MYRGVWTAPIGRSLLGVLAGVVATSPMAGAQLKTIPTTPTTQPGSTPAPRTLTMDEAVNLAISNSRALRIAAEAVERARGRLAEQRAGYMPSVGATGTFTRLDEGSSITFPGPTGQPETITIVKQNQKSVGVAATLPVDIMGLIGAAVDAAHFQEIAARLDFNSQLNQTVVDTKNAYYGVLQSSEFVGVAETALKNAQDRETTAEAYLKAGTGTRFDVLRAQTDVANAQQGLIAAQDRVNLAVASLNNLLGLDQNTPTKVTETSEQGSAKAPDYNAEVATAYAQRPEVLQADANIRAAEKGVKIAERSALPSLGVSWNFQYTPDAGGFSPKTTSWAAVAQVSLPLFDQGLARARVRQARADVNSARVGKQQALDAVALDVRQNSLALVEAQQRLDVATTALTAAEEQYRLAQVRFHAGVTLQPGTSPLLEISDAQTALTQAQANLVNARYDVQNARARLDRAAGRYAWLPAAGAGRSPGMPAATAAAAATGGKK